MKFHIINNMKKINNFTVYLICIIECLFMFLLFIINNRLNVYSSISYTSLSILFLCILIIYVLKRYRIGIVISFLFIINALFFRYKVELEKYFNFEIYLDYWFKHIDNEVVFYNILGNVLIFIPFSLFVYLETKNYFNTIQLVLYLIVLLEFSQAIFKLGVFDIVDIVLNFCGVAVFITGVQLWKIKTLKKNN